MVDISHFADSEVSEDGYSHSNSYLSRNLHDMHIVSTPILPFSHSLIMFPYMRCSKILVLFWSLLVCYMLAGLHDYFYFLFLLFYCGLTLALNEPN